MYDVVTIGSAVRDFFLASHAFKIIQDPDSITGKAECFALGTKIDLDNYLVASGGGAVNSAITFARQGLKVAIVTRVGDDASGTEIIENLKKEGVDIRFIQIEKNEKTASSFVLSTAGGQRTILTYRGASGRFSASDLQLSKLRAKWLYITSLAGNFSLLNQIIAHAENKDFKIAVIPGKAELETGVARLAKVLNLSDVFFLNREEASLLTGVDYEHKQSITHALCLLTRGIGVVTDGEEGATVCDGKHYYHIGVQKVKAIDATGAGDAFASGFVAGMIRYGNIIEPSLKLATNNAASVVTKWGASTGSLKKQQLLPGSKNLKIKIVRIK